MRINKKKNNFNIDDSLLVLCILAMIAGTFEVYSFFLHGGIFSNAQTGNIILLFITLLKKPHELDYIKATWWEYLIIISLFVFGICIATLLRVLTEKNKQKLFICKTVFLCLLIVFLCCASVIKPDHLDVLCVGILACCCAIIQSSFSSAQGHTICTTMMTNNLKIISENLFLIIIKKGSKEVRHKLVCYFLIFTFFIIGGVAMYLIIDSVDIKYRQYSIFLPTILVIATLIFFVWHHIKNKKTFNL